MVKFPHPGLLLKLLADAFLVTQLADSNTSDRDGSKFRDELSYLAEGKTLKNFKNLKGYLLTQLNTLDDTGFLSFISEVLINSYQQLIKTKFIGDLSEEKLCNYLLRDACAIVAASINEGWHDFYAPTNQLAKKVHVAWFLPDLSNGKSALGILFDFLEKETGLTQYAIADYYDNKQKLNRSGYPDALGDDWVKRSILGEFAKTELQTFKKLEKALWLSIEDKGLMDKKRLRLNLLLARGFDYLLSELQTSFDKKELSNVINFTKELAGKNLNMDILPILFEEWKRRGFAVDKNNQLPKLYKPTDVETKKLASDEKTAKELFDFFNKNPPTENLTGILDWYRGRFYVLSGELEEGLKFYKQAFANMQFVWGNEPIEKVITESLALTAFLGKNRRFFADVYYYGALIGMFDFPEEKELDYWFHQWGLAFNTYFSPHAYYPSVSAAQKQKIIEQGSWIKAISFDEQNKAANKKSKTNIANTRPKSQLQAAIHASEKSAEDVIKLIDSGADVNFIDNSGGTVLIESLQTYYGQLLTNKDQRALQIINRLLEEDLSESINSITKGYGISALSLAIEAFDLEMIERLIKKGADVKGKCDKPEMSYIYYTLNRYSWFQIFLSMDSPEEIITMMASSAANPQFGATANEQAAYHMQRMKKPENKQLFDCYINVTVKAYQEINASEDKTVSIIKLLLENGASPCGHFVNKLTPLMFATELGLTKVVKLLLENGADKNAVNNCGKKVIDYAIGYHRPEIRKLLEA